MDNNADATGFPDSRPDAQRSAGEGTAGLEQRRLGGDGTPAPIASSPVKPGLTGRDVVKPSPGDDKMAQGKRKLVTFKRTLLGIVIIMLATEAGVRLGGLADFPIYSISSDLGYIPKPDQSGAFLNRNTWVFNDRSMGTATPWNPTARPNILLIGNSVVMGGDAYSQDEKLGPQFQAAMGKSYGVWSIAAGGWTNVNETVYLEKNPDVVKANHFFVWEYMGGGLSQLSDWQGEYVWPSKKPVCATCYVFRRYLLPRIINFNTSELPPTGPVEPGYLAKFDDELSKLSNATGTKTSGIIFLYPDKAQFLMAKKGVEWLPERKMIEKLAAEHNLKIVDVAQSPEWNENLYREGTHPTAEGNAVLAKILSDAVTNTLGH